MNINTIAFDADDTLWHNETYFHEMHTRFSKLLSNYHNPEWIEKKLYETEMRNLKYFGYGIKGFTLSMIETAIELTESRITASEIREVIGFGHEMLKAPVRLLPGAEETVKTLKKKFPLMLITKGDLFDQESKIARSGVSDYFDIIEILSMKTPDTYGTVFRRHGIDPSRVLMVGNSLKSDILPILEIGGYGVFIPYPLVWKHEKVINDESSVESFARYAKLENIRLLPDYIDREMN